MVPAVNGTEEDPRLHHILIAEPSQKLGTHLAEETERLAVERTVVKTGHQVVAQAAELRPAMALVSLDIKETEAEAVAYVVCKAIGLDANTAACDYILHHKGDKETIMSSLKRIKETAGKIIPALL